MPEASWLSKLFTTGKGLEGLGSFASGLGSIYGGYRQANAMEDMNDFRMNAYNDQVSYEKENDKRRQNAGSVYGSNNSSGSLGSYSTPTY